MEEQEEGDRDRDRRLIPPPSLRGERGLILLGRSAVALSTGEDFRRLHIFSNNLSLLQTGFEVSQKKDKYCEKKVQCQTVLFS